jgi:CRISPR/Cas system CSM-associated protein Csm2 small subunit
MTILAKSAMAAGTGVMLTANGMNIMVNALNRLTKENIDSIIKLFNEVNWPPLVDPIGSISASIHRMSVNADKLGIGMKMSANALVLMSTIPVEILKEIAAVFDSLAKSDLTKQGEAMLLNVAPALASISATMLVMRSDAYIRMFEVMASSSEAIVAMSRPMTNIASALDKMGGVNVDGIEWAHKMARQLARSSFNSQATAMEKIAASYGDISNSSNSMNVEAINATTDMFKALAYLYQNGRKNAMEELGEKLTDAIRELARMISDFEGTVNDQAEGSKTVGEAMAKAVDGLTEAAGLTSGREPAEATAGGGDALAVMQELIDLLQSGQAKITITDLDPAAEAKLA